MRSSTAARRETAPASGSIERARPLLGTIVSLRIAGLWAEAAHRLADVAFAGIARVHDLMSFQDPASELSRINREAAHRAINIHPHVRGCFAHAINLARRSGGAFDPVRAGGTWRDIVMIEDHLRTMEPVTIDLSGIAKGYAVDLACDILTAGGAVAGMVNAGGDLRVFGPDAETIVLRPEDGPDPAVLTIADGAVASSDAARSLVEADTPQHFDGRTGRAIRKGFVTVCAPRCIDADALTKVVLAMGDDAAPLLGDAGATAHVHDKRGWRMIAATEDLGRPGA